MPLTILCNPQRTKKDLVHDGILCGRYKYSTEHRRGKRAKVHGSYEHQANINFCLGGITNEIHMQETPSPSDNL